MDAFLCYEYRYVHTSVTYGCIFFREGEQQFCAVSGRSLPPKSGQEGTLTPTGNQWGAGIDPAVCVACVVHVHAATYIAVCCCPICNVLSSKLCEVQLVPGLVNALYGILWYALATAAPAGV